MVKFQVSFFCKKCPFLLKLDAALIRHDPFLQIYMDFFYALSHFHYIISLKKFVFKICKI